MPLFSNQRARVRKWLDLYWDRRLKAHGDNLSIDANDIFLVSYPRSGNTWVRFLLANVLSYGKQTPIDFYSVRHVIPDAQAEDQRAIINTLSPPRIIKSHRTYTPAYPKVIYVVRDARDVYVSYYHHLSGRGQFQGTFAEFLLHENMPLGFWSEHITSWLGQKHTIDLTVVRYRDLLHKPERELGRILRFAEIPATPEQIEYAIEKSSFTEMRKIEETRGRPYATPKSRFVRRGTAGQWADYFDDVSKEILKSRANQMLLKLGFIETPNW